MTERQRSPAPPSRQRPRNLNEQVIWSLGSGIVAGTYADGTILPGDGELMAHFGVSRTVLREALKALHAKGMVEPKARVGTRVLPRAGWNLFDPDVLAWHIAGGPDADLLRSIMETRLAVEAEGAALAASRRTPAQAELILDCALAMAASPRSGEAFADADLAFHHAVADASGNPFMRSISALVETALTAIFRLSSPVNDPQAFSETVAAHRLLADAIAAGRPEEARQAMTEVIRTGYDRSMRQVAPADEPA